MTHVRRQYLLLLQMSLNVASIAGNIAGYTSKRIGTNVKLTAPNISTMTGISHNLCQFRCGEMAACNAYNYNGTTLTCNFLAATSFTTTAAASGWISCRMINPLPAGYNTDACLSSPCPNNTVCVSYLPSSNIPFRPDRNNNYTVKGYMCSTHSWLLTKKAEGKTSCKLLELQGKDYVNPYGNTTGRMLYQNAINMCQTENCLSLICLYTAGLTEQCWLKSESILTAGTLTDNTRAIYWYPTCF